MPLPTPLHLTPPPPVFDDRAYRWMLRDSGYLSVLTPAETKLLLLIYCMADREGIADVPGTWSAERLGLTARAVREARKRLEKMGLIVCEGQSPRSRMVKQYRLIIPTPGCPKANSDDPHGDPRFRIPGNVRGNVREALGGSCDPPCPQRGTQLPPKGERGFPQRDTPKKYKAAAAAGARVAGEIPGGNPAPLYQRDAYDAAAAALLVDYAGFDPRVAHGLVSQYRPTAAQLQNVVANIDARNAAAKKHPGVRPVESVQAFMRAAMKKCDYTLDERAAEAQRAQAAAERVALHREQAQQERMDAHQHEQDRAKRDAATWDSLTPAERMTLRAAAERRLRMPAWQKARHAKLKDDAPMIRALILGEHYRQQRKGKA